MPHQKTTESEIINRAIEVFRRKGYDATSMQELADACGLTKGLFYHYFPNKKALMLRSLEVAHSYIRHNMFDKFRQVELSDAEKEKIAETQLVKLFNAFDGGCFFANTALGPMYNHPEFQVPIRIFFEDWRDSLEHWYRQFTDVPTAKTRAEAAMAEFEGSILLMQVYKDSQIFRRAIRRNMPSQLFIQKN